MAKANKVPPPAPQIWGARNLCRIIAAAAASIIVIALTLYISYELDRTSSSKQTQNSIGTQSQLYH